MRTTAEVRRATTAGLTFLHSWTAEVIRGLRALALNVLIIEGVRTHSPKHPGRLGNSLNFLSRSDSIPDE